MKKLIKKIGMGKIIILVVLGSLASNAKTTLEHGIQKNIDINNKSANAISALSEL